MSPSGTEEIGNANGSVLATSVVKSTNEFPFVPSEVRNVDDLAEWVVFFIPAFLRRSYELRSSSRGREYRACRISTAAPHFFWVEPGEFIGKHLDADRSFAADLMERAHDIE